MTTRGLSCATRVTDGGYALGMRDDPDRVAAGRLAAVMLAAGTLSSLGCVGEASVTYRGIVTAGESPGHEFVDLPAKPAPGAETPADALAKSRLGPPGPRVADVRLVMHVTHLARGSSAPTSPCAEDRWIARDSARAPKHPWPVTSEAQIYEDGYSDEAGRVGVYEIFPGFVGSNVYISLCVLHPGYETYVYAAVFEETSDPKHGERLLHVVLRPKGPRP